jgi:predicted DNA-binding protein
VAINLAVRVPEEVRKQFIELAARYGGTSYVLRELVLAFVENRVEIVPPKNPLYKEPK